MRENTKWIAGIGMIVIILLSGCAAAKDFGRFEPDKKAGKTFEIYQVNPDYRYYITGSDTYPVAILALDKSYSMGNDLWKEVDMTPKSLKETVTLMKLKLWECCMEPPFGFLVYDPREKLIGMMYSYLGVGIAFQVKDHIVNMYGPQDDDSLKRYQGRTNGHQ